MAAVCSEVCAICGAQHLLPSQRFKLWDEAAAPTVLCRQLTVIVGEPNVDRTRMLSKLSCRSCRSSLLSLVRLKERFDKSRGELLKNLLKNSLKPPFVRRRLPALPEKRPFSPH